MPIPGILYHCGTCACKCCTSVIWFVACTEQVYLDLCSSKVYLILTITNSSSLDHRHTINNSDISLQAWTSFMYTFSLSLHFWGRGGGGKEFDAPV